MKPMLASDADETKLVFPLIAQPKIDGVRALNIGGTFTGRSLKGFGNRYLTAKFGNPLLAGLDGEVAAWKETDPDLCRRTTSALSSRNGEPFILWWLFDYFNSDLADKPYFHRLDMLTERYHRISNEAPELGIHLRVIPWHFVTSIEQLIQLDTEWLAAGFEGTIVRNMKAKHKQGRSTVREGGLLRIKRFVDFEFVITGVIEGEENTNEAMLNPLGQTERSTRQENMIPNGMVGALIGTVVSDVKQGDTVLFCKGQEVKVAAGRLTHDERRLYFAQQDSILGKVGKAKFFPKGIKDKPRFPTFQCLRDAADME